MSKLTFLIVIGLCLVFFAMNVAETYEYQTWMRAVNTQRELDSKVAAGERVHVFIQQLVRRIVSDAQTDPGVADVLHKHLVPPKDASKAAHKPAPTTTNP